MGTSNSAQDLAIVVDDLNQSVTALHADAGDVRRVLGNIQASLHSMVHMLAKEYELGEMNIPVTLTTAGITLDRKGRRFMSLFTPVAITGAVCMVMGVNFTFNLVAGWNVLNMPDGTTLQLAAAATAQPALIKVTNWTQAGVI